MSSSLRCCALAVLPLAVGACAVLVRAPEGIGVEPSLLRQFIVERTDRLTGDRQVTLRLPLTPNDTLVAHYTRPHEAPRAVREVLVDGAPEVVVNDSLSLGYDAGARMRPATLRRLLDARRIEVHIPAPRYETSRVRLDLTQREVLRAFVAGIGG